MGLIGICFGACLWIGHRRYGGAMTVLNLVAAGLWLGVAWAAGPATQWAETGAWDYRPWTRLAQVSQGPAVVSTLIFGLGAWTRVQYRVWLAQAAWILVLLWAGWIGVVMAGWTATLAAYTGYAVAPVAAFSLLVRIPQWRTAVASRLEAEIALRLCALDRRNIIRDFFLVLKK